MEKQSRAASGEMRAGQTPGDAAGIDATTKVNDVLRRRPLTGEVFIQRGPLGVSEPGKFYVRYPDETVGEYAERNGVDLKALLDVLRAAAEATSEATRRKPRPTARGRSPEGPIGYTLAYRDVNDFGIEIESVVASQLARGPD